MAFFVVYGPLFVFNLSRHYESGVRKHTFLVSDSQQTAKNSQHMVRLQHATQIVHEAVKYPCISAVFGHGSLASSLVFSEGWRYAGVFVG